MNRAAETASVREARLAEIRRQIRAGTYETRERLSAAIDAILEDFADQPDGASGPMFPGQDESETSWPRPK
jgi:hypothetical protein